MIKPIFHLFKIHGKMVFGNTPVIVQNMLSVTPKSFNAVNVVLAAVDQGLAVVQPVMLAPALEGVVAAESVRVVNRPFSGALPDMGHEFIGRHLLHHLGVYSAISFQKPQNNAFPGSAASASALPAAAEVTLVYLNL